MTDWKDMITSEAALREKLGAPSELAVKKEIQLIDHHAASFIARSPFLVMATADASGRCQASPRGDQPGFVRVLDDQRLVIPERPGNKRFDSLLNLIENPHVGLEFFIPGMGETLRVNGTAVLTEEEDLLASMAVKEKKPWLAIGVTVESCFVHCAKALRRSELWKPDTWPKVESLPRAAEMMKAHAASEQSEAELEERLQTGYRERLY
ncbi:pyridoxamine 5'-phosphate oxidase family protein [Alkalicoccus luteus]|uniref:pyridoxamine 5'-phosphate oxidase family protein n=1 Tax=Alkalicoccus luteus TaxID=1237094 RepID=UPI0040345B05